MSFNSAVVPFFAQAPSQYDQNYISQVTRAFSVYAQQMANPGPVRADTLNLTGLSVFANNAAALTGGLVENDVYKTATGELRIVV
jgi:hypothetical protein|tara:strand:+ start:2254 stop:2508 length:255 start_codon:yes stop_codon:yes gene_type:complete